MPAKILVSTENIPYADWLEYRKLGIDGSGFVAGKLAYSG